MKDFWRVFEYIWPQWPRLIVVFVSAILIGILFSLSFMTIVPLLKVMMGEEGLHGWVDRKVCERRYSVKFYVPDRIDFIDPNKPDMPYYLLVRDVEQDGLGYAAGLRENDRIVGAGRSVIRESISRIVSLKLLQELATSKDDSKIRIQYMRFDKNGSDQLHEGTLDSGSRPFYLDGIERVMKIVPRQQSQETKTLAISLIIIMMAIFTASTRDICPAPIPTVLSPWAMTMALDLTCLTTRQAKSNEISSSLLGFVLVAIFKSRDSIWIVSLSWTRNPPKRER